MADYSRGIKSSLPRAPRAVRDARNRVAVKHLYETLHSRFDARIGADTVDEVIACIVNPTCTVTQDDDDEGDVE